MVKWRSASIAMTAAALAFATAACGGKEAPAQDKVAPAGAGGKQVASVPTGPAGELSVWESKELGDVLTDSAGFTLYRFDKDTAKPPTSRCAGDCAKTWPVVPAAGASASAKVGKSALGSVTRADGTKQLTVGGWPVYRYVGDTKPKQANGQGSGGVWFAAAADGSKAAKGKKAGGGTGKKLPGLSVRQDPELGKIVVDKRGFTVYRFTKDSAWPMKSACTGACLDKWPVVGPVDKNDAPGIVKKNFLVMKRPDGIKQQTVNCWPVYTFKGDKRPGDTNGQGVGGTWYAVSPEGKLVKVK
ncbi:SCO0930 family lipoprotein [Streptomyces sp. NPDC101150]|uniref:SCO0930 family lipoprotein n=1 Tax=Streptomyces sp. NPDC101150 TaxID=3366114 RepID=UPI00382A893E